MSDKNIQILILTTGQEVISEVQIAPGPQPGTEIVKLVNPCEIRRMMMPDGSFNAQFVPMAVYALDETLHLSNQHVVCAGAPKEDFGRAYDQLVNPNAILTPPEKKLIVPQ